MAGEIIKACMDLFSAVDSGQLHNALYTALNGKLYFDGLVPSQEVMPYGTIQQVVEVPQELLDDTVITATTIQFNLYSNKSSSYEALDLLKKLLALYDNCTFTLDNGQHINTSRTNDFLNIEDNMVWHAVVQYRVEWTE